VAPYIAAFAAVAAIITGTAAIGIAV